MLNKIIYLKQTNYYCQSNLGFKSSEKKTLNGRKYNFLFYLNFNILINDEHGVLHESYHYYDLKHLFLLSLVQTLLLLLSKLSLLR